MGGKIHNENFDLFNAMGIEYNAVFVPFSQSRNKESKHVSLNWKTTIKRNGIELTTDYMQGIGNHPFHNKGGRTPYDRRMWEKQRERSAEDGKLYKFVEHSNFINNMPTYIYIRNEEGKRVKTFRLPAPSLKEVLYCLIMDSSVLDCASFEEWAIDCGYDTDSIKGKAVYDACLKIALQINRMFPELENLKEYYQNY